MQQAAAEYSVQSKPLYKISAEHSTLTMHPDWLAYFHESLRFVRAWASWHYLQYMQKINPTVPSLANKLFPPAHRESLKKQADLWDLVAANSDLRCIYSGERIQPGAFEVDHFLPWSFVVHNELWNLVPATATANSSKSDRLPDERYIDQLVTTQRSALLIARENLPPKKWMDNAGVYPLRLNLGGDDWLDSAELVNDFRTHLISSLLSRVDRTKYGGTVSENPVSTGITVNFAEIEGFLGPPKFAGGKFEMRKRHYMGLSANCA